MRIISKLLLKIGKTNDLEKWEDLGQTKGKSEILTIQRKPSRQAYAD